MTSDTFSVFCISDKGQEVRAIVWDTLSAEAYRGLSSAYYRGAVVVFLVYSIADRQSFDAIDKWLADMQGKTGGESIIFLVGNKIDLANERAVSFREGKEKALSIGAEFHEVSAAEDIGIQELFNDIARAYFARESGKDTSSPLESAEPAPREICKI